MKRLSSKILILTVAALTVILAVFSVGCSSGGKTEITVASDLHFLSQKLFTEENYSTYATADKMVNLSEAIMRTFADKVKKERPDYLLVSGDLTEKGDETSHEELAKIFAEIEKKGTQVFVINGNHDVMSLRTIGDRISPDRFKEIYADYGYSEALSTFAGSLSYTANLGKNHRLIAIDDIEYYNETVDPDSGEKSYALKPDLSTMHVLWIKEQVEVCKTDGKIPVVITHVPLKNHYPAIVASVMDKSVLTDLADYFGANGVYCAFTGHLHVENVRSAGSFTDIASPSLIHYPCSYREVKLYNGKKGKYYSVSTERITRLNSDYMPQYASEEEKAAVKEDFEKYTVDRMRAEITAAVNKLDTKEGLLGALVDGDGDGAKLMRIVARTAQEALSAPIYKKDERTGETSMESFLSEYGVTLPKVRYKTVLEMSTVYAASVFSDRDSLKGKDETELVGYFVYYFLSRLNARSEEIKKIDSSLYLDIDLARLVKTGKLECYDSGIVGILLKCFGNIYVAGMTLDINELIGESLDGVKSLQNVINVFTGNVGDGLTDYFSGKEIRLGDLIYEGIFTKYAPEIYDSSDGQEFEFSAIDDN